MNTIFKIQNGFTVPDGTVVFPFLNAKDSMSNLPFNLLDGFSIAAGEIPFQTKSKIHIHPFVSQVCILLFGKLNIWMKDNLSPLPYKLTLEAQDAVLTPPGTFFQLDNAYGQTAHVLYIVSPAYLFYMEGNEVIYDDALVLEEDWAHLKTMNWKIADEKLKKYTKDARIETLKAIEKKKNN